MCRRLLEKPQKQFCEIVLVLRICLTKWWMLDSTRTCRQNNNMGWSVRSQSRLSEADPLPVTTHFIIAPLPDHLFHPRKHANTFPVSTPLHQTVHDRFYWQKGAKISQCPRVTDCVVTIRSGLRPWSSEEWFHVWFFFFGLFSLIRLGGIEVAGESESLDICQNVSLCWWQWRSLKNSESMSWLRDFSPRSRGFRIKYDMLLQQGIRREHLRVKSVIVLPDNNQDRHRN